ncbi:MAG: PD40 domain-containing protein [Anaerolineales bacterium]|nr:PD40 domain-containing protein [Anaerolineales bacterium]
MCAWNRSPSSDLAKHLPRLALAATLLLLAACDLSTWITPQATQPAQPSLLASPPQAGEATAPTATALEPVAPTAASENPAPSETPPEPQTVPTLALLAGPQLAFLNGGNLWLIDGPGGAPYPVTQQANLFSFAWAPDGARLATFDGRRLCFVAPDGSPAGDCLDMGLDEMQVNIPRQITWSPDQRQIILWNRANPWDEGAIGWLLVALDGSNETWAIEDPVDWGASLSPDNEPGGITGQPVFLPDGRLVGTVTHRWLCGSGGCQYHLYQFDSAMRSLAPFDNQPQEGWSGGAWLTLSNHGRLLINYGTFHAGCESYTTYVDSFNLQSKSRKAYTLEQETISALALSPDQSRALIARTAGCNTQNQFEWDDACGLSQGFDIYALQLWNLADDQRQDLLPGSEPAWSPDGDWIAFRSCLAQNADGGWEPDTSTNASIYVLNLVSGEMMQISEGAMPAWQP